MYWATYLVFACIMLPKVQGGYRGYGFVMQKLPKLSCISNPINDVCPVDHKVPNISRNFPWFNSENIKKVLNITTKTLRVAGGSDECVKANEMFQCSQIIYVCQTNLSYVYLDTDKVHKLCMTASDKCNATGKINLDNIFNCTQYENATVRYDIPEVCKEYPDVENDTCPKQNYKVPQFVNFTSLVEIRRTAERMLKENNVTKNCTNSVLRAMCYIGFPACTRDETYMVSLLGRNLCRNTMKCVESANSTILTNSAMMFCQNLPDENTAKNISIKDIEIPKDKTEPPITAIVIGTDMTVPTSNTTTNTTSRTMNGNSTTEAPCCGTASLSSMVHIFIVTLLLASLTS